jgi:hypothetical protein
VLGGTTPRGFSAHGSDSELPPLPGMLPGTLRESRDNTPMATSAELAFRTARQDPRADLEVMTRRDEKEDPPNTDR